MTEGEGYSLADRFHGEASVWLRRRDAGEQGVEEALAAWLSADPRHREAFEEAELVWGDLQGLKWSDMRVSGLGSEKLMPAPLYMRRSTHIAVGIAASIALACFAAIALAANSYLPELITPAEAATYRTGLGEIRTFRLAGGSAITLDTDSEVRIGGNVMQRRLFVVRGRVRVHGGVKTQAFVVSTPADRLRIEGSEFDAMNNAQRLQVAASSGPIFLADVSGMPAERKLAAGQEISLEAGKVALTHADLGWTSGMLTFDGTRLDHAIADINRYNRTKLVLTARELGMRKISGAFRVGEPAAFADLIARMYGLRVDPFPQDQIRLSPAK